jgi:hypothetical protein
MRFKKLYKEGERVKSINKIIEGRVNVNPILSNKRGM